MPETRGEKLFFGVVMSITMAVGMEIYNVAISMGYALRLGGLSGMTNAVFPAALAEAAYMWIFVFIFSNLWGNRLGHALAGKIIRPGQDNPFFITLMVSGSAGSGEGLKDGWQYLEADLTSYAGALIRINSGMLFRAMVTTGGIGWFTTDGTKLDKGDLKGYILIDNLCIVYGANNQDVTAPVVNSIQLVNDDGTKVDLEDGMTLDSDKLRFFVTYNDSEDTDPYATGVESAYFFSTAPTAEFTIRTSSAAPPV